MLRNMRNSGPPLTETSLRNLELRIGIKLPKSYRTFLLSHNGGVPEPAMFPIQGFANNPFDEIQEFFPLKHNEILVIWNRIFGSSPRIHHRTFCQSQAQLPATSSACQ